MKIDLKNLAALYAQTPEMVCLLKGPEHVFEFVNEAHVKALGFDATGMPVKVAQPESVQIHGILDEVYQTGETAFLKEIAVNVGGRMRYFDLTYAAMKDDEGQSTGVMILGKEITDQIEYREHIKTNLEIKEVQKKALELALKEASLTETLEVLVTMVEEKTSGDARASVLILDESKKHLLHGAAPKLPAEYNKLIHGIAIGPRVGSCGAAAYHSETTVAEDIMTSPLWEDYREIAKRFNLRSCWSTPIVSSKGEVLGTFALYHDYAYTPSIHDQEILAVAIPTASIILERQREINLRVSAEERLSVALHSGKIGFWDWNAKTGHTFLSDTLMKDWGIDPRTFNNTLEECVSRIHVDDRERVALEIDRAITSGTMYDVEYKVVKPSEEVIWINAKGQSFLDEEGLPKRLTGITINVTDRRLEEEKLKEALRSRDEFISIASHELKTPLTSLRLKNQSVLRQIGLKKIDSFTGDMVSEMVQMNEKQVDRLIRLIDDMLDVSRIRSEKLSLAPEIVNVCDLVEDVVKRLEPQFKQHDYEVKTFYDPALTEASIDRIRVEQVVINLLTNAIRYGRGRPVEVRVDGSAQRVSIRIKDHGLGIDPAYKDRIFKRFERAINSSEVSGLGLGLYISQEIVKAHQGDISVTSTLGEGSEFTVELPRNLSRR